MNELNDISVAGVVKVDNNELFTTSLVIADMFDKQPKDIMKLVKNKMSRAQIFARLNEWIIPSTYLDKNNQRRPMYKLTKDGFTFIANSLSGIKADMLRIAFIDEFNRMADALNRPKPRKKLKADFTTDNVRIELFNNAPIKVTEYEGLNYYFFNDLRLAVGYRKSSSRPWRNMRPIKKVHVINQDKLPNGIYNVVTVKDLQLIINDHGANKPQLKMLDRFIKEHRDELTEQTTLLLLEPEQTSLALDIPTVDEQVDDFNKFKKFQELQGWS